MQYVFRLFIVSLCVILSVGCAESDNNPLGDQTASERDENSNGDNTEDSTPGIARDFSVTNQKVEVATNGKQFIGTVTVPGDGVYEFPETIAPTSTGTVNWGSWIEILVHLEEDSRIMSLPGGDWGPLLNFYSLLAENDSGLLRICYQFKNSSDLYEHGYTSSIYQSREDIGCGVIASDGIGRVVKLNEGDSVTLVNVSSLASAPVDLEVLVRAQ